MIEKINFNKIYYEKVGARKALAISKLSFVALAALGEISNKKINNVRIAIGSVGHRIVRLKKGKDIISRSRIK